jgi:cyclopropane fatty-acyl-phospholipid synthase-like methyltransferase
VHSARAALRAWLSYRGAPLGTRVFLAVRLLVLPLPSLAREFRELHGRVLAVGSGHGMLERWIAELNPDVTVDGLEIDAGRVAIAQATAGNAPRVRLRAEDVRELDEPGDFDAALAVDLIHHVPQADHAALAEALARAVKPGGVVLIKDIARTPGWQHWWNSFHDRLVTGAWSVDAREPDDLAAVFERAGFVAERSYRVGRASPYPHFMLRLRRSPS